MGFATETVKYILFFFNFLCALAGILLLVIAILVNNEGAGVKDVLQGHISTPSVTLAIVGGFVFITAFFGCCGAIRESHCMLITYAIILLTLLVVEVGCVVLTFVYRNQIEDVVQEEIRNRFGNYSTNQKFVDGIQKELKCCGANGPDDWRGNIPASCCKELTQSGQCKSISDIYTDGCSQKIIDTVKSELKKLGVVAVGVAFVKAVAVIFSLCLASSIKRHEMRGYA